MAADRRAEGFLSADLSWVGRLDVVYWVRKADVTSVAVGIGLDLALGLVSPESDGVDLPGSYDQLHITLHASDLHGRAAEPIVFAVDSGETVGDWLRRMLLAARRYGFVAHEWIASGQGSVAIETWNGRHPLAAGAVASRVDVDAILRAKGFEVAELPHGLRLVGPATKMTGAAGMATRAISLAVMPIAAIRGATGIKQSAAMVAGSNPREALTVSPAGLAIDRSLAGAPVGTTQTIAASTVVGITGAARPAAHGGLQRPALRIITHDDVVEVFEGDLEASRAARDRLLHAALPNLATV